jgi:hypothetical protein
MHSLSCFLFSNDVRGQVSRGSYSVSSHLISYKQIVPALSNMPSFWGAWGGGVNWPVPIYVPVIEPIEVYSQYSNFRFALLHLKVEWDYCSLNMSFEKLNGI